MKDGNEGHGMNKKYEKFKLAVGTTFAFFILVAVMGIAFVQNRYADENILEDELLEIQGDEKFHYVETGITYWQYKKTLERSWISDRRLERGQGKFWELLWRTE